MNDKAAPPEAPAAPGNDNGLANDLQRLEAGAAAASAVPPEVAAMRQQQADQAVNNLQEWAALVEGVAMPTFDVFTPNWKISQEECKALGQGWAPVLNKYFPDGPQASPEITALLVTVVVFGSRAGTPMKAPEVKAA